MSHKRRLIIESARAVDQLRRATRGPSNYGYGHEKTRLEQRGELAKALKYNHECATFGPN